MASRTPVCKNSRKKEISEDQTVSYTLYILGLPQETVTEKIGAKNPPREGADLGIS